MPRAQVRSHDGGGIPVAWYSRPAATRADKLPRVMPGTVLDDVDDAELARGIDLGVLVELDADGNPVGSSEAPSPTDQPVEDAPMRGGAAVEARRDHAPEVAGSTPAPASSDDLPAAEAPTGPMPGEPAASATQVETVEVAADKPVTPADDVPPPATTPGSDSTPEATEPTPAPKPRSGRRRGGNRGS